MTIPPRKETEGLAKPVTFYDVEALLADRLSIIEEGKGHWAECMQMIEKYKDDSMKPILEAAGNMLGAIDRYKAEMENPGVDSTMRKRQREWLWASAESFRAAVGGKGQ